MISQLSIQALKTLGSLIRAARRDRGASQTELAERLGVTRQTIMAIEKGDPKVAVGTVFEVAYIIGIPLFSDDTQQLSKWQLMLTNFLAMMPNKKRHKKQKMNNDF